MDKKSMADLLRDADFPAARAEAERTLMNFPGDKEALFVAGRAAYLCGEWSEAASYLELLVSLGNPEPWVIFAFGDTLFHLCRYDEAARFLNLASDLTPGSRDVLRRLADVQMRLADWLGAVDTLAQVASDNVRGIDSLYYLGVAQYRSGDWRGAAETWRRFATSSDGTAVLLEEANGGGSFPIAPVNVVERKILSQNGEDGIILRLFSEVFFRSRCFIEIGFHPREANCITIALLEGLSGLFIDGNAVVCAHAKDRFQALHRPDLKVLNSFIYSPTVNDIIRSQGFEGELEILSVDVDGNDYWIWKAIDCVSPRLVIMEMNVHAGPDLSISIPYEPNFVWRGDFFHGASLRALTKLAAEKGYALIGCDTTGANAFFLRKDLFAPSFPELSVEEAYAPLRHLARPTNHFDMTKWQKI